MTYKLNDIIDMKRVNELLDSFSKATGFVTAILDLDGIIISKSGWRNICAEYHHKNQESLKNCLFNDSVLADKMKDVKQYKIYKCPNGLIDVAIPIIINQEHIGYLFSGQFFFEKPDKEFFIRQAETLGFDEKSYINALNEVPVFNEEQITNILNFLLNITKLISHLVLLKEEQNDLIVALKESEKRYKKAQSLGKVGNWEYNLKTSLFWGSDEAKRIYGFAPDSENFTTKEVENCIPDRIRVHQALIDLIENNKEYNLQFDIITNDTGQRKTIQSFADLERDLSGKPVKVSGVIIDVTERIQTNKSLMESETKYYTLLENLPQRIFSKDLSFKFSTCNNNFAKDLSLTPKELLGKTDFDFYPKDLAEKYRKDDIRIIESGKPEEINESYVYGGKEISVHTVKTPLHSVNGEVIGIMGIFWDVTELNKAELALKKYRDDLEKIISDRTKDLEEKNAKLEKFNKLFVDREFRIKELKDRIKELENKPKEN